MSNPTIERTYPPDTLPEIRIPTPYGYVRLSLRDCDRIRAYFDGHNTPGLTIGRLTYTGWQEHRRVGVGAQWAIHTSDIEPCPRKVTPASRRVDQAMADICTLVSQWAAVPRNRTLLYRAERIVRLKAVTDQQAYILRQEVELAKAGNVLGRLQTDLVELESLGDDWLDHRAVMARMAGGGE